MHYTEYLHQRKLPRRIRGQIKIKAESGSLSKLQLGPDPSQIEKLDEKQVIRIRIPF